MKELRAICKTTHPKKSALVERGEVIKVDDDVDLLLCPYYELITPVMAVEVPKAAPEPSRLELLRAMSAEEMRVHLDTDFTKIQLDEFAQAELGANPPNRLSKADSIEWVADLIEMDSA